MQRNWLILSACALAAAIWMGRWTIYTVDNGQAAKAYALNRITGEVVMLWNEEKIDVERKK